MVFDDLSSALRDTASGYLPFVEKIISLIRKRSVILSLCMVIARSMTGYYVAQRVTQLDAIFYGPETKSLKALALCEIGAY